MTKEQLDQLIEFIKQAYSPLTHKFRVERREIPVDNVTVFAKPIDGVLCAYIDWNTDICIYFVSMKMFNELFLYTSDGSDELICVDISKQLNGTIEEYVQGNFLPIPLDL